MKTMAETLVELEHGLQQCIAEENAAHDRRMRQEGAILVLRQMLAESAQATAEGGTPATATETEASNG